MRTGRQVQRDGSPEDEEGLTLASVRRYISFLIVRLDYIFLDTPCAPIEHLNNKGSLSGFKLSYKIPRPTRGNASLDREVFANGSCALPQTGHRVEEIQFKHKKVFPLELDPEIIELWNRSSLGVSLNMVTASSAMRTAGCNDRKNVKHLARTSIHLSELLVPPFAISRDCALNGADFHGRISVSVELGSKHVRIAESLAEARKSLMDETFVVQQRDPARRTRARSGSRCRSHSQDEENRAPLPSERISRPPTQRSSSSRPPSVCSRQSQTQPDLSLPCVRSQDYAVPYSFLGRTEHGPTRTEGNTLPAPRMRRSGSENLFQQPRFPQPVSANVDDSDDDSVFTSSSSMRSAAASTRGQGALQLELTLHDARNLPMVEDRMGNLVPPMAYIQMLGRDEQVVSTIAPASLNPTWNWKGKFVISSERGNVLIKVLHKQDDKIGVIGIVTLSSPLQPFDRSHFEVSLLSAHASRTAVITLSLRVRHLNSPIPLPPSEPLFRPLSRPPSRPESEITWVGDHQQPRLLLRSRNSHSTSPRPPLRRIPFEEISYKLQDDVDDLLKAVNCLGK